ncbi:MAG TPA: penicillin-binding protein 2 [Clostridiales bacterium]|nr:penicillin-binding protein 2 [Clostridiales bacterium]
MRYKDIVKIRLKKFYIIIVVLFLLLMLGLFNIQIINHDNLSQMADSQYNAVIKSESIRGDIVDRNGISFTKGRDEVFLIIFPKLLAPQEQVFNVISILTGKDVRELSMQFDKNIDTVEIEVVNMDYDIINEIESGKYKGVYLYTTNVRYDENSIARHVIGYIQKDGTPIMGIEKNFDMYLNSNGKKVLYTLKDAKDNLLPGVDYGIKQTDTAYYDVELTIDYYIQEILEKALEHFGNRNGGIVVEIDSGEILALASRPNYRQYDLNSNVEEDCLWAIPLKAFPAGSVFKVIVAAAALEDGRYCSEDIFYCNGGIEVNGVYYSCHRDIGGLGRLTLEEAFSRSCNDTFISITRELGGESIIELSRQFGFGNDVDIGLDNDRGTLPARDEYAGAGVGNLALGQGSILVTPIQVADMMTTIANGGVRKPLRLVRGFISNEKQRIRWSGRNEEYRVLKEETAKELQKWLIHAAKYGTGEKAYSENFGGCGGKTGTPQINNDKYVNHYGWFAGFFPMDQPKYVIAILSREEGGGGKTAAPIFKEVAEGIWRYNSNLD